jgi:hypothetical protein
VRAKQIPLALVGGTGADDSNPIFFGLGVDHDDEPALHRTDRDESILVI